MPASAIAEQFRRVCRETPRAVGISSLAQGRSTTFADLLNDVDDLSRALTALGIGPGANVVSAVGNSAVFAPLMAAALEAGVALLPLGEATDVEVVRFLGQCGASAVVTDRELLVHAADERHLPSGVRVIRLARSSEAPYYGTSVVVKLTSGSTDLPKAAVASELHLINDGRHVIDAMGLEPSDVNLACIPLSHSYALGNLIMPLLWQGTGMALRRTFNPAQFVQDAAAAGATVFPGVPFLFERLQSLGDVHQLPKSLRLLITAGARIDLATVRWFKERLHRKIHSFYGSTETGGIAYDDSDEWNDPLHVGRPMPETTVTIRRTDGSTGQGRIFVQGNAVTSGYVRGRGGDSISAFCDGGFLTGDLGYLDETGRLVLTGRVSALVNVAGRKVDPVEVERALVDLPGISDARVLGMPCDQRGQQVVAFVVRTDSALTPLAIRQRCAASLSTYKIPRRFVFVDRFPVDARGKIDRRALQALLAAADEA